jgi:soluble lytic murein transglycosylase-like protein
MEAKRKWKRVLYPLTSMLLLLAFPLAGEAIAPEYAGDLEELSLSGVISRLESGLRPENKADANRLGRTIMRAARKHRLSPALILALIETESSFRYAVHSRAGAVGLMQLKPSTAAYVAERYKLPYEGAEDLEDPVRNVRLGIAYLAYLKDRFGHSAHYLAAYNLGPARLIGRLRRDESLSGIEPYVTRIHGRTRVLQLKSANARRKLASGI